MLLQTLITGLSIGGIYALMAVGYSLVFSVLNFSNFAHGAVIMLGAYIGLGVVRFLAPALLPAVAVAMIGAGVLAVLNERLAYSLLRRRKAPSLYLMISAMGCAVLLENLVYATIGSRFYAYPEFFATSVVTLAGSTVSLLDLFAFIFSIGAIGGLHLFRSRPTPGIAIRAGGAGWTMCSLMGVNLDPHVARSSLAERSRCGGHLPRIKYLSIHMGWISKQSLDRLRPRRAGTPSGALNGGLILGIVETLGSTYLSSVYRDLFSFGLLIALLLYLPNGLLGRETGEKV
jgi:branched-chain amino acid transport system permease protein